MNFSTAGCLFLFEAGDLFMLGLRGGLGVCFCRSQRVLSCLSQKLGVSGEAVIGWRARGGGLGEMPFGFAGFLLALGDPVLGQTLTRGIPAFVQGFEVVGLVDEGALGFFLPGDSLLFTAGFLASQNVLNVWVLAIGCFIAAVTGDSVGYTFGRRVGAALFKREDSRLFKKKYLEEAQKFYEKHGNKTIVLARFVPIVRTFAPILAGAAEMHYTKFISYNVIGGFVWSVGVTLAGYFLGNLIPDVDRYLLPIIVLTGDLLGPMRDVMLTLSWVINVVLAEWIIRRRAARQSPKSTPPEPMRTRWVV